MVSFLNISSFQIQQLRVTFTTPVLFSNQNDVYADYDDFVDYDDDDGEDLRDVGKIGGPT